MGLVVEQLPPATLFNSLVDSFLPCFRGFSDLSDFLFIANSARQFKNNIQLSLYNFSTYQYLSHYWVGMRLYPSEVGPDLVDN